MKVAISSDFFTSLSKLPKNQLNLTVKLVEKFKSNPKSPGLNYEKLHFASNMHSIRVDGSYRCIVMSPKDGGVYILLWVDKHDDAYDWAKKHTCQINPETGSLQVIQTEHKIEEITVSKEKKKTFFSRFKDKELKKIGVSDSLLEPVKKIDTEDELDQLRRNLPEEVYEALFYLLAGDSFENVYNYVYDDNEEQIDTNDFSKALDNDSSKRNFYVVEDNDKELMNMLNAPLEKWRVFLHPSQRKLVEKDYNGPVRVLGGAGTGKTVVAMHRAKYLAKSASFFNTKKILFTTFTKNLAIDIHENLKKICNEETLSRIEVKNLDQWVYEFLSSQGYKSEIVYTSKTQKLWENALAVKSDELDFSDTFFKEEWERIIQPQSITTLDSYIRASRVGRGTKVSRKQRKLIWEIFEEYRLLLTQNNYKEPSDAMRDARKLIESGKLEEKYESIVVDEAQDFSTQAFKLLRSMVETTKNDMFIVGDAHQRIYGQKVILGQCGIEIRGRSKKLKLNYRTTDEIRKWAIALLSGETIDDLDDGIDSSNDYKSLYHGPKPQIEKFDNFEKEVEFLKQYIDKLRQEDETSRICIVARTQNLVDSYYKYLVNNGIKALKISRTSKDDLSNTGIRVATMHRVKGLDFDHVIITSMNRDIVPLSIDQISDEEKIEKERVLKEKSLVFVAATRAKKSLLVSSYGDNSSLL
ncbi:UvrD-helicase domain-containing protein [Halarcobacter ebronensis]|uniref:UvrD-helicase domain-containing protein n=1 Tax=Halarcobacter ebronensis TaxID=1462615 RepID=UPI003C707899